MTAMEFFNKMNKVERSITAAMQKVELMKSMAERITTSLEGDVVSRTRNVHSFEDSVLRFSEAKDELSRLNSVYSQMVDFITERMSHLKNPEDATLLLTHYVKHTPLTVTAVQMHHCYAWAYKRHPISLKNLDILLIDVTDEDINFA